MYQDYKDLLSAFHAHGVRYLIVGGYAVIFHAQPRFTRDIDFFIKADPATRKRLMQRLPSLAHRSKAFARKTSPSAGVSFVSDMIRTASIFFPTSPASILTAAWERRVEGVIDATTGLKAFFISSADLVAAKLASGRPQDLADVDAIRKAAESQAEPNGPNAG